MVFSSTVLETCKKSFSEYFISFADSLNDFPLLKNQSVGIGLYSLAQPPEISGKLDLSLFLPPTDPAPPTPLSQSMSSVSVLLLLSCFP